MKQLNTMKSQWHMKSPAQRWAIVVISAFLWTMFFWYSFGAQAQTPMPPDLAQCYDMMGSGDKITGDSITQSLEIARKFHSRQRDSRRDAMTKAVHKFTTVKPRDVLLYLVPEVACLGRVRVGSTGDGGKWMCSPWRAPKGCVVYSLGSFNDVSFESDINELTDKRCSIVTVDMVEPNQSTRSLMREQGIKFVKGMVADETKEKSAEYTIGHIMKTNGHEKIDILKMDIEGSEFTVLPEFMKKHKVCQLLVEIHDMQRVAWLLREIANNGYLLMNYEINAITLKNGMSEYSFIHSSCLATYETHYLSGFLHS